MRYDLHIHSSVTDGKHSRTEILTMAKQQNLKCISFTEHNNYIETLDTDIKIINGIEFDVKLNYSFHLLCYFPKISNEIEELLKKYRYNTSDSTKELVKKIKACFSMDNTFDYQNIPGKNGYKTKRDVITWLLENNYAKTVDEASMKYTGKNAISYIPKYSLLFEEVVECIHNNNGLVFLAHPESLKMNDYELEQFVKKLAILGLDGIEVLNLSKNKNKKTEYYLNLANKYGLLTSSGSDFHDDSKHELGVENEYSYELLRIISDKTRKL